MNKELRELLDEKGIVTKKITLKNSVRIITTDNDKLVVKRKDNSLKDLYLYLKSRSFQNFPNIIFETDHYDIYPYIEDNNIPKEERALDLIKIVTYLHNKTTFYKEIDDDDFKKIYEDIIKKIDYLYNYYQDIIEVIEQEEYMSPSNYYFARNVSKLFASLDYCRDKIEAWYEIIKDKKRIRIVNIHNNLSLDHYLVSDRSYLISWRLSKKDMPIYDLLKFYKRYYKELDFCELLRVYEINYPLLEEEKLLFLCLASIPDKIEFYEDEFTLCKKLQKFYDYIFSTEKLIQDYFLKDKKHMQV